MKDRIGTYSTDDGSVKEWPAKTLTGQGYNRHFQPHSTVRISKQHFAVMDLSPLSAEARDKLLDELRALVSAPTKVKAANEPTRTGD